MEKEEIFEKIKEIIIEQLGVKEEEVIDEAKFVDDLGADSLDLVEMVMSFEDEYGIEISDKDAEKLISVGDAINYIHQYLASQGEGTDKKTADSIPINYSV